MPLTRSFDETVRERAEWDTAYREMLLPDTLEILLDGDVRAGKILLHQCIYATIGYEKLGSLTGKSPESIKRILTTEDTPSASDLFEIIKHIRKHEGIRLEVKVHPEEPAIPQHA